MAASDHLSRDQFYIPAEDVGGLRAGDFHGHIGDKTAERRFVTYNNQDGRLTKHREAGGVKPYLDAFTERVRQDGQVRAPITLTQGRAGLEIYDGHHRALAAHRLGLGLWARVED